ncbi:restriction endonuclease subunit S [Tenacibaculum piscium]|uniref:restriction endonuclease subunit S n=1 Tax=Tenacibaculum piscium TaxID=1458515 RepID=UPI00187BC123|nr:restriction endonuclease subunit S [Tenacibaculum piscium]MBE7686444.1 restriction endonuclease subunit S [Tenacibaculum piscium]
MSLENKIPNGWIETTLGEVCEIKYGKDHKKLNEGKIPCLGSGGIMRYVDEILYDKPSVLIPRKGTLSNLFYIDKPFWTVDTLFYTKINTEIIDPIFLYFKLKTYNLANLNVGSAVPSLTTAVLNQFPFEIPKNIEEQVAIAKTLTAFEDKIENLQAQNNTLETTAQTIFKEWFGKYQIGDELPEGWRVGEINDLIEFIIDNRGKTPPLIEKNINSYSLIEVNSITGDDRNVNINLGKKFVNEETYQNWFRKGHPINGDILLSTVGSIGQLAQVFDEKICIAQNIIALRSNTSGNFLYELLKINQKLIINLDISSVQPSIKVPHLLAMPVIIPNIELIEKFDKLVDKLSKKITSNNQQIQTLKKTRDTLLPKLMNGELRVKI